MLYDKDIREPLFDFLEETYGKTRIIEEKNIGRSRADIMMVMEDALAGVEIKSDADTYVRLKRQVIDYDRFFDKNIIVVGTSHAMHIMEHVPEWWGIITVDDIEGQPDFYVFREMKKNPKMDLRDQLHILWRPELAHIQELNGMPKYKEKSKEFVISKITLAVPENLLKPQICTELFERDYNEIRNTIVAYRKKNGKKR
ncbi:MAG: sce7726 family protein [Clostridiales bacterium]|nr:sce7726 family protein [Clostridiales bacterium]